MTAYKQLCTLASERGWWVELIVGRRAGGNGNRRIEVIRLVDVETGAVVPKTRVRVHSTVEDASGRVLRRLDATAVGRESK